MRAVLVLAFGCGACAQIFGLDTPKIGDGGSGSACTFRSVSAGRGTTCAADGQGVVWCWGGNNGGKVDPGGDQTQPVVMPRRIALPAPAAQVSVANVFACARLDDGTLWCWGENDRGALGAGDTDPRTAPVQVQLGNDTALDLDTGAYHACARLASTSAIACWGDNSFSDLAQPASTTTQPVPVAIAGTNGSLGFALGHRHACMIDSTKHVQCWGRNRDGELGTTAGASSAMPLAIPNLGTATQVAASGRESCAVEELGDARCWGANESGELGNGSFTSTAIPGGAAVANAAEIHAGAFGACARLTDGSVQCWGSLNAGNGGLVISSSPLMTNLAGASALSVKFNHTCVIAGDQILCWGINDSGELGRGTRSVTTTPIAVALAGTVTAAAAGAQRACAVAGGHLYCWGLGGLGDGTANGNVTPIEPAAAAVGTSVTGVSLSPYSNGCALVSGSLYCWGNNNYGQIGIGMTSIYEATPKHVLASNVVQVSQSDNHTCAVFSGGGAACWGRNNNGQLGNGTLTSSPSPIGVGNISSASKIVTGYDHTCALDGPDIKCWGDNYNGQLGDGTNQARSSASKVVIPGTTQVLDIAAGSAYTCAIDKSGNVWCWGQNQFGQLGLGDLTDRNLPTQVSLPKAMSSIRAGGSTTCAQAIDGTTYCWGDNYLGQFGNGTTVGASAPIAVSGLPRIGSISFGGGCAVTAGALDCWGSNWLIGADPVGISMPAPVQLACTGN